MSQATTTKDPYVAAFHEAEKALPGQATAWVAELRSQAIEAYKQLGWPTRKQEAWKYTDLSEIRETSFEAATAPGTITRADLEAHTFDEVEAHRVVLVDGFVVDELSDLPDGEVTVASIAQLLDQDPERLEGLLGSVADATEHPLRAINTALFRDGVLIDVPAGSVLETPVHVINLTTAGADTPRVSYPRVAIRLGRNAEATVIETYAGLSEGPYLTNAVTEIEAADNAHLRHYKLELENPEAFHLATQQVHQTRDATVRTHNICLGGKLIRNDVNAVLDGEGGTCLMNGLFSLIDEQHCDNHTRIDHVEPNCESHQLYKGIVDDKARGVFWGRIFVDPIAQKTNADQHNPNLLLSDEALVDSTPQLEIFADDVRCTHGSTFGQLDAEQLFYMQSRGIDEQTSRAILTYAFAGDVLNGIQLDPVRQRVEDLILERLPKGDLAREALRG